MRGKSAPIVPLLAVFAAVSAAAAQQPAVSHDTNGTSSATAQPTTSPPLGVYNVLCTKSGVWLRVHLRLYVEGNQIRLVKGNKDVVVIPAYAVTHLSYAQATKYNVGASAAVGALTLGLGPLVKSKNPLRFVNLTTLADGTFAMECREGDYQAVLAGLEGITGKKAHALTLHQGSR
jgi:hypothetical protein